MKRYTLLLIIMIAFAQSSMANQLSAAEIESLKNVFSPRSDSGRLVSTHMAGTADSITVRKSFDSACLSSKDARLVYAVRRAQNGDPEITPIISNGNARDNFYCEQTIWETFPFAGITADRKYAVCVFDGNSGEATFPELDLRKHDGKVRIHLIPQYFRRFDGFNELMESAENVVMLSSDSIDDPLVTRFRQDWQMFLRAQKGPFDAAQILSQAEVMRERYKGLFLKKEG
jgi:hypothetical protein